MFGLFGKNKDQFNGRQEGRAALFAYLEGLGADETQYKRIDTILYIMFKQTQKPNETYIEFMEGFLASHDTRGILSKIINEKLT